MASAYPTLEAALKGPMATEVVAVWTALASAVSATGGYVRGLHAAESIVPDVNGDPLALVVQNVAPYAVFVDEGHAGFHLPEHITHWRTSKNGKRFVIVRFRHFTEHEAPSGRAAKAVMPTEVQQLAKALHGRPLTGVGDLYRQSKSYVYYRAQHWPEVPAGQGYTWKKSKYEGIRHVGGKTPGGGTHGGYDTFRMITPFSQGFYIPPVAGQHFPEQVLAQVGPSLAAMVAEAAGTDLQAHFAVQMNSAGVFTLLGT